MVRTALILLVLGVALFFANHYVPLQPAVVAAYLGLGLALAGLVSLVRPLKFLGIRGRLKATIVLLAGVALAAGALWWPPSTIQASGPHQRLDDFMASYSYYERHETRVRATTEQVGRAVKAVRFSDIPVAGYLMRVRAMASGRFSAPPASPRTILETFETPGTGFLRLDATRPGEYVGGMVGRPWTSGRPPRVATAEEFQAFRTPGYIKVAFNIRWVDEGGGITRVTTETRCQGTNDEANRIFGRYWRVIYPGSAIIRRAWLNAIGRIAAKS